MYVCEKCLGIFKHDGNHRLYCGGKLLWVSQKDAKTIKELKEILKEKVRTAHSQALNQYITRRPIVKVNKMVRNMKAKLYIHAYCPKCSKVMFADENMNIHCINPHCDLFNIVYESPSIELKQLKPDNNL